MSVATKRLGPHNVSSLVPAAAVIPALKMYLTIVVKKLVVGSLRCIGLVFLTGCGLRVRKNMVGIHERLAGLVNLRLDDDLQQELVDCQQAGNTEIPIKTAILGKPTHEDSP
ncbi:hypothetical protein L596_011536 [Steinernema carpocapsae]|uniref:Uncharacterized protein n=1 Tax=Steinernema carpocapsae TaxID=34508 RepID=A0A4U5NV00_STECR|nr:hypothetical protein L596_011536 [Steinernema carpocapsae]